MQVQRAKREESMKKLVGASALALVFMIGSDLPQSVIEALIHQLSIERRDTSTRPLLTPWISPMKPASFSGGGVALGAALLPFLNTLLLPPASA